MKPKGFFYVKIDLDGGSSMSSKKKIIVLGIIMIILNLFLIIFSALPKVKLELNGKDKIILNVNDNYNEFGASAYLKKFIKKENIKYNVNSNLDSSKLGDYEIVYEVENKWGKEQKKRYIKVIDNKQPILKVQEKINICKVNKLVFINANAIDNYDGNITSKINYKIKNDKLYLSVKDSSDNITEITRELNYIDSEKPTIKLNGNDLILLNINEEYIEEGAIATDSCDGDLTDKILIESSVNTKKAGEYRVIYKITDSYGNEEVIERKVIVEIKDEFKEYPVINGATIYLTFDDGPYKYTEDILNTLKKYNIKATFFVTNQFPAYSHFIRKEYEDGHSIGIHTYTHQWSIYQSKDTYLNDFNKIDELIFKETGIHTKIFRFPGGSSNRVSRNYKVGIMSELSKHMTEQGYKYFDWNVDSGDTNKNDSSTKAIIKNFKKSLKGDGTYVVLMHDIKKNTALSLEEIITYALERGYTFSALNENSPEVHFKIAN
ncbi:MAG: DUF5011 domain-containing protein [Clostridiales bacterium]|nr:DUF5011 domain-containing protein [Clostridiales bacterium]